MELKWTTNIERFHSAQPFAYSIFCVTTEDGRNHSICPTQIGFIGLFSILSSTK